MSAREIKYQKIEEDIIEAIRDGRLGPGDKIESESILKQKYKVSTITVRKAFSDLINQGYLYGIQGVGTFVAKKQMIRELTSLSFSEELLEQKYNIDLFVDAIEQVTDKRIAQILNISPKQPIVCIRRVRLANDEPVAFHISYIDSSRLGLLQAQRIYTNKSFYKTLEELNIKPTWASENYSIRDITDARVAELMRVKKGTAAFYGKRTAYSDADEVIEYSETYFNRDWYSVSVTIKI